MSTSSCNIAHSKHHDRSFYTDDQMIQGMRRRDAKITTYVYQTYQPRMLAVAKRILRCEQEAQDAVQEAIISAIQSISQFNGQSRLGTWLHRIVVNAALMRLRKVRTGDACYERCAQLAESVERSQIDRDCGYQMASSRETSEIIREQIDRLPYSYKQIVYLRDLNETDTATTAKLLGCSESNVKTRLHRARAVLREMLSPIFSIHRLSA